MPIPSIPTTYATTTFKYPDGLAPFQRYDTPGSIIINITAIQTDKTDALFVVPSNVESELAGLGFVDVYVPATDDTDWATPNWKYTLIENFPFGRTYEILLPYKVAPDTAQIADNAYFTPVTLTTRTITGTYVDFQGNPLTGNVTFTLEGNYCNQTKTRIVIPAPTIATLDANGTFTVNLYGSDTVIGGLTYTVTENIPNGRSYTIKLPGTGTNPINISNIAPAFPNPTPTFQPVWSSLLSDDDETVTTLEPQYADFAVNVPTRSASITTDTAAVTATNTATYATISPIIDERLMPFLLNGAANNAS